MAGPKSQARCLFRGATPLLVLQFQQFVGECPGGRPEMGTRPGTGKRDVLPPPRLRRLLWPHGRRRAGAHGDGGRRRSNSSDGSHVLRLASPPTVEALRPGIRPIPQMPAPLPIPIWMTRRSSSDRCEYTSPTGATSLRTGYPDNPQSNGCCTFYCQLIQKKKGRHGF